MAEMLVFYSSRHADPPSLPHYGVHSLIWNDVCIYVHLCLYWQFGIIMMLPKIPGLLLLANPSLIDAKQLCGKGVPGREQRGDRTAIDR